MFPLAFYKLLVINEMLVDTLLSPPSREEIVVKKVDRSSLELQTLAD